MKTSEQIGDLAGALSKAQGEIKGAAKDSKNPFFKSSYADLSSIWNACRDALAKNGLAVIQTASFGEHGVTVCTRLAHASGQWVEDDLTVMPGKMDPQGIGSTITYLRRYALSAITGVAPEDDDANSATDMQAKQPTNQVVKPQPKVTISDEVRNEVHEKTLLYLGNGDAENMRALWRSHGADEQVLLSSMFNSAQRNRIKELITKGKQNAA